VGHYKQAIFDKAVQQRLLDACEGDKEYVVTWMFLNTGIHPKNLGELKIENLSGQTLAWKRAKNARPRREMLPEELCTRLTRFLRWRGRPKSRVAYFQIIKRVGDRAGIPNVSPMTLRHTFCINLLREYGAHPQTIDFVAKRMGCSRDVVIQNYIDLGQWEQLNPHADAKL
jgi:integrase